MVDDIDATHDRWRVEGLLVTDIVQDNQSLTDASR